MTRALVLAFLTLLFTALTAALAVLLGVSALPVMPGVIIVAYAALADPPVEAAITAALCGLVLDTLTGTPLGVNVIACVLVLVASRLVVAWVTQPRGVQAALFVAAFSGAYAFVGLVLVNLFQTREAFGIAAVPVLLVTNGVLSFAVLPVLMRLLVLFKLQEKGESLQQRLSNK